MICYARLTIASGQASTGITWTFPQAFIATPSVVAFTDQYVSNLRLMQGGSPSSTSINLVMINQSNAKDYGVFSATATGRWK